MSRPASRQRKPARIRTRSSARTPTGIDAYLATLEMEPRALLAKLRRTIRAALPDAVECVSYGMPAFRVDGRVVAGFQATARGGSFYPFSGGTLDAMGDALEGFGRTKSALHFDADRPLPASLVRRLLRTRLAEARRGAPGRRRGRLD
jgi:uncharacterized protein YdhG (YjbR/CyaY superfamily)